MGGFIAKLDVLMLKSRSNSTQPTGKNHTKVGLDLNAKVAQANHFLENFHSIGEENEEAGGFRTQALQLGHGNVLFEPVQVETYDILDRDQLIAAKYHEVEFGFNDIESHYIVADQEFLSGRVCPQINEEYVSINQGSFHGMDQARSVPDRAPLKSKANQDGNNDPQRAALQARSVPDRAPLKSKANQDGNNDPQRAALQARSVPDKAPLKSKANQDGKNDPQRAASRASHTSAVPTQSSFDTSNAYSKLDHWKHIPNRSNLYTHEEKLQELKTETQQ